MPFFLRVWDEYEEFMTSIRNASQLIQKENIEKGEAKENWYMVSALLFQKKKNVKMYNVEAHV